MNRVARLVLGLGLVALGIWVASHADRGPGRLGDVFRRARARGHDTGAMFYTELEDWQSIALATPTAREPRVGSGTGPVTAADGSAPIPP